MLKIYDQYKNPLGYIKNYKDLCIESELESGDKTLSFTYCAQKAKTIQTEYYIETQDDWYVVKEVNVSSDGYPEYSCQLDLEDLEADMVESFSAVSVTCADAAALALAGTGWTVDSDIEKLRSVATLKATPLTILGKIRDAFMCEIRYDTKNKVVYFREEFGEDRGVFFTRSLNLRKVKMTADTYDYYTRIVPIGADDLRITDVNDGVGYVENYQYSNKIHTLIWEDTSYEDADALLEDATAKLEDMSKPKKSYSVDVVDLAKQKPEYSIMDFSLGDTILLLDEETGIKEKQRIVKLKEYPGNSWENECELSNTTLTWEELQSKLEAAANAFEEITNSDGTINGYYVYGVTSDGVVVIETSIGEDGSTTTTTTSLTNSLTTISGNIVTVNGELDAVSARIGTVETTYLSATEAELIYATIKELDAANANISRLDTKYANIASAIIGEAAVNKLIAGEAEIDYADITGLMAKYAQIDLANVEVESVGTLFANVGVLTDVTIVNGHITGTLSGVTIYGDCIVANTIVADSLVLQGADGLYYAINATSESLTSSQLTDEKYQNYIDGSVIVAKSITADQIAAGTITANEINVLNLFAQDITATGTITGLTLEGGSINIGDGMFTVDSSGKMVAKSGSFSGDVGATSFSLDDVSMYVDTIMASIDDRIVELINSYPALDYEVTVAGYGSPDDVGLSASDYTGQYYIDAIIGETGEVYIYYSNGTTWKLYDTLYATIAGDSLDEIISQIQEVVQENLIQIFVVDAENGMRVDGYFEATNGKIGDWTLDSALYSGLSSIDGTDVGTYIGIDGIRQYGSSGDYIDIRDGVLSINGVDISIGSKTISFTGVTADGEGAATLYTRDVLIIDTSSGMYVNGVAHLDESVLVQTNINYGSFDYLFGGTLSAGTITGNKLSLKSTLDVTGAATFNSSVSIPISNVTIGSSSRTTDCSLMMRNSDNYMSIYLKSGGMGIYDNTLSCDVLYHASTGALTVGNTTYATTVKGSTITLSGATTVSGNLTANSSVAVPSSNITVGSSSRTTNSQVVVQTSNGTGCLYLNADGSFGLWSNTKSIGVVGISSSGAWTAGSTSYQTTLSGYGVYLTSSSGYSAIFTSEGNFRLNSDAVGNLGTSGYRWKNVYASNSSIQTSDANEKTNIVDIDERYEQLFMLLRGVNYMWRNYRPNDNHDRVHCGLIAQEVETACAEVGLDSTTFAALCWDQLETPTYDGRTVRYSLAYGELHGLEIHMIQKCVNNISDHESRITELETKLSDANATIASLTKQLNELQASAA